MMQDFTLKLTELSFDAFDFTKLRTSHLTKLSRCKIGVSPALLFGRIG